MGFKGTSFLYTLATLMVTFAGFSALLLIIRQAAGAQLSALDRFLARTTIGHLMALTAGALLPSLLQLYDIPESSIWMISAAAFGLPVLALLLTFPHRRVTATGASPPPIVMITFVGLSSISIIAMLAYVEGNFAHKAAAYITALTINFFSLALAFIIALEVVLHQPISFSQKPGGET
jgi:hypothetical protein